MIKFLLGLVGVEYETSFARKLRLAKEKERAEELDDMRHLFDHRIRQHDEGQYTVEFRNVAGGWILLTHEGRQAHNSSRTNFDTLEKAIERGRDSESRWKQAITVEMTRRLERNNLFYPPEYEPQPMHSAVTPDGIFIDAAKKVWEDFKKW